MFGPCLVRQYLVSLLGLQSQRKRELDALLEFVFLLPCECVCSCLFLMGPNIGLECVIVAFHCHIHFLFHQLIDLQNPNCKHPTSLTQLDVH